MQADLLDSIEARRHRRAGGHAPITRRRGQASKTVRSASNRKSWKTRSDGAPVGLHLVAAERGDVDAAEEHLPDEAMILGEQAGRGGLDGGSSCSEHTNSPLSMDSVTSRKATAPSPYDRLTPERTTFRGLLELTDEIDADAAESRGHVQDQAHAGRRR